MRRSTNLARDHRQSAPKKKHENYRNFLSKKYRQLVSQLSGLLRLAVALDQRRIDAVKEVQCEYRAEIQELHLQISLSQMMIAL